MPVASRRRGVTRTSEEQFSYTAEIVKAEQNSDGTWTFDSLASLPTKDLQGESLDPMGLETDYLFGKGLPPGAGGHINWNHDDSIMVGIPLEGRIGPEGFRLKWQGLKTPFMKRIVEQMKALKDAGNLRRYGMSVEGIVKERDPSDPSRIKRAFIRNVALTPTPVHPGSWVDFAKSLTAGSVVDYDPDWAIRPLQAAQVGYLYTLAKALRGSAPDERYFARDGTFLPDRDIDYFSDVYGLSPQGATTLAHWTLTRQDRIRKALTTDTGAALIPQDLEDPFHIILHHNQAWKARHPADPHLTPGGNFLGGLDGAKEHFTDCEHLPADKVAGLLKIIDGSALLDPDNAL